MDHRPPPPYHLVSRVHSGADPHLTLKLALLSGSCKGDASDAGLDESPASCPPSWPMPTRVSPSDVEIGIVTPGSERSSISGHVDAPKPTLFDVLPDVDVIQTHILPTLPLQSLFALRGTCCRGRDVVNAYFRQASVMNITQFGFKFAPLPFHVMTDEARRLRRLLLANAKQWLTDDLLIPLLKRNPHLVEADFSFCSSVSNKSVHVLAVGAGGSLAKLSLRDCHWLSCDAVLDLAIKCRHLRHVDISGCWDVGDDAVVTLVSTNPELEFLSLAKIYGITDKTVVQIAHRCHSLRHLNLHGCWRVSNGAVKALAEYAPLLTALRIRENTNVTEASLGMLRRRKVDVDVPPPPMGSAGLGLAHPVFQPPQVVMPVDFAAVPPPNFMNLSNNLQRNHMNRI